MAVITNFEYGMPSSVDPVALTFNTSGSVVIGTAIPHGTTVELYATEDCYLAFGTGTPTATTASHPFPAKTRVRYTMHGDIFIAARGQVNTGDLLISNIILGGGK